MRSKSSTSEAMTLNRPDTLHFFAAIPMLFTLLIARLIIVPRCEYDQERILIPPVPCVMVCDLKFNFSVLRRWFKIENYLFL